MEDSQTDGTLRALLVALAVVLIAPLLVMLVAFPVMGIYGGMMGGGMMGDYGGTMGGYSPLWGIVMVLIPVLVIGAIAYVAYRALGGEQAAGATDPALSELRLAYARGDLSDEEYETRRDALREDNERE